MMKHYWTSYDGKQTELSELSNEHLANIINHIKTYPRYYTVATLSIMLDEAKFRGLSDEFLAEHYMYEGYEECQAKIRKNMIRGYE